MKLMLPGSYMGKGIDSKILRESCQFRVLENNHMSRWFAKKKHNNSTNTRRLLAGAHAEFTLEYGRHRPVNVMQMLGA